MVLHNTVRGVSARALERFAARAQVAVGVRGEVDVLITSNAKMRDLSRRFRGKSKATDVLSFPAANGKNYHGDTSAGDIAISGEVAAHNARRLGHTLVNELKILILHGLLHLVGYDHETDRGQMARKEARLRQKLGLPVALIERATRANGKTGTEVPGTEYRVPRNRTTTRSTRYSRLGTRYSGKR